MILQVTFLGSSIVTDRAKELPGADMELHVLLEVASISCFVVAMGAGQWFGPIVNLSCVPRHFVLIGCHIVALLTFKRLLT